MLASFPEAEKLSFFGPLVWLRFRAIWWSLYVFFQSCQNFLGCYWLTFNCCNTSQGQFQILIKVGPQPLQLLTRKEVKKGLRSQRFLPKTNEICLFGFTNVRKSHKNIVLSSIPPKTNVKNYLISVIASKKWLNKEIDTFYYPKQGLFDGFQLVDLVITELKNHMTC